MLSIVVSYSSMEEMFLDAMIRECTKASSDVVFCVGTHLYDGTPETPFPTERLPTGSRVSVVTYAVDVTEEPSTHEGVVNRPTSYWHNVARWTGIQAAKFPFVLLLDGDEIPKGDALASWAEKHLPSLPETTVMKMATHWFFKFPTLQAYSVEDSMVLAHKRMLSRSAVFGDDERDHIVNCAKLQGVEVSRMVRHHTTGAPMFRHYSYVRKDILAKLSRWAHKDDLFTNEKRYRLFMSMYDSVGQNSMIEPIHGYQLHWVEDDLGLMENMTKI